MSLAFNFYSRPYSAVLSLWLRRAQHLGQKGYLQTRMNMRVGKWRARWVWRRVVAIFQRWAALVDRTFGQKRQGGC